MSAKNDANCANVNDLDDLRLVFDSIDTNKNGTIELSELKKTIKQVDGLITDQHLEEFFRRIVGNTDRGIDFDEFVSMLRKYVPSCERMFGQNLAEFSKKITSFIDVEHVSKISNDCEKFDNPLLSNPIQFNTRNFVTINERVLESCVIKESGLNEEEKKHKKGVRQFIRSGPRKRIAFDPSEVIAAIVTCGGICPGINTVIRDMVICLCKNYYVTKVYGVRFGYEGFYKYDMMELTPKLVANIHNQGGTILGTSRGGFDLDKILEGISRYRINQVYIIGGDGTHRGAQAIYEETVKRGWEVSIACCPKTIDNDFQLIDRSFGFQTACEQALHAINSAKVEAEGCHNGIGLVKLMGRQSGFIALNASLASRVVDYCLIPEVPFHLTSLLRHLKHALHEKGNVVIVAAEGAGAHLGDSGLRDKSGNPILIDVGLFLKKAISEYFKKEAIECCIKYIDPTYMIRSIPANASDSIYCTVLAHNAIHGAMAGFTGFTVGLINNHYVYIPIPAVTTAPKMVNPNGRKWYRLMESTHQPDFSNISNIFISLAEAVEQEVKPNLSG